jgi:hypothetical protein
MYNLLTVLILVSLYLEKKHEKEARFSVNKIIVNTLGILTHYYFFVFKFFNIISLIFSKKKSILKKAVIEFLVSIALSSVLFPYMWEKVLYSSITKNMYSNALEINLNYIFTRLFTMGGNFTNFTFGTPTILSLIILILIGIPVFKMKTKKQLTRGPIGYYFLIFVGYFITTSIFSPFDDIRYIMPISYVLFLLLGLILNISLKDWSHLIYLKQALLGIILASVLFSPSWIPWYFRHDKDLSQVDYNKFKDIIIVTKHNHDLAAASQFIVRFERFKVINPAEINLLTKEKGRYLLLDFTKTLRLPNQYLFYSNYDFEFSVLNSKLNN